jgi:hypothetical protein
MAITVVPRRPGLGDYIGQALSQLAAGYISNMFERDKNAKKYELDKRTADEEMARQQQMAQWRAEQLYGAEQSRPLGGAEQALNVAGYTPGGSAPAMDETYREGGILNGIDMRGNHNDALGRIITAMQFMDPESVKQTPHVMNNLNPDMSFQTVNQGDRITAGGFDHLTGDFNGQEYGVGINPGDQYVSDNALRGIMYGADSATQREAMNQAGQDRRAASRNQLPERTERGAPDLKTLMELRKQLLTYDNNPIPGMEERVRQLDAAIGALITGRGQNAPGGGGLTQREIEQLKAAGYPDEEIAALGSGGM